MIRQTPSLEQLFHSAPLRGWKERVRPPEEDGNRAHGPPQENPAGLADEATQTLAGPGSSPVTPGERRFSPGEVIAERFRVIRYIARGGMGEVYEVEDRLLRGVRVALKVILPAIADDPASSRRFEQEVILARKISHPNLCPIYDIARSSSPPPPFLFLTMKLIAGETLSARLRRPEPLSRDEKVSIAHQVIAGLAAIHSGGVIHRDIKPNNVMLDFSGPEMCVVIMDFGLARLHEPEETAATGSVIAGTPGYMAPEILDGQGPSQATDLFALGVLLHQVFTGERPAISPHTRGWEPSLALEAADIPGALKDAVMDLLAPEPKRRCDAFQMLQATSGSIRLMDADELRALTQTASLKHITRRQFFVGSAAAAGICVAGVTWKWDRFYDLLHPLPTKRFVALLNWPAPSPASRPMLLGVIEAIGRELARAESSDHNLLVLAPPGGDPGTPAQLSEIRDSLGANLVLAASAKPARNGEVHLGLQVLDAFSSTPLRAKEVRVALEHQATLPEKAVRAAAILLGIHDYTWDDERTRVGTNNPEAFAAFRDAEALRKEENDAGLEQAIEKYKEAIDLDPTYAVAQAKLAWAYLRAYALKNDPAALALASLNCKAAIHRRPNLVDAHLGLASVLQTTGDQGGATEELAKALSLDPSDPHTITYQANFYASENQWQLAEQTFARVLSLRPNYWLGHQELGVLLDVQGKYREALVQFRAASLAAPRNALAIKNTGSVYLQLGELPQAFESLSRSFKIQPNSDTAIALAELFRIQHRYADALDYADQAIKLNASNAGVWLELADVQSSAGRRGPAEQAYRQAASYQEEELRTSPKDGPKWMWLALCRAKLGQAEAALTLIAKAEANHADDMDSQLLKIRILELAGRREDALATMARCLSRGPAQFQLETMPDLEKLRASSSYKSIVASKAAGDQA